MVDWATIKFFCDDLGMAFFNGWIDEDVDLLEKLQCDSIKIASADVNHSSLRRAARTGMSIQLDTGMATLGEIEMAVKVIEAEGNKKSLSIIVHLAVQRVWKV